MELPHDSPDVRHAHHLYVVRIDFKKIRKSRKLVMGNLRRLGISTQVHYIPVYRHPYYQNRYKIRCKDFPMSEDYYSEAFSLPIYPGIRMAELGYVINKIKKVFERFS